MTVANIFWKNLKHAECLYDVMIYCRAAFVTRFLLNHFTFYRISGDRTLHYFLWKTFHSPENKLFSNQICLVCLETI